MHEKLNELSKYKSISHIFMGLDQDALLKNTFFIAQLWYAKKRSFLVLSITAMCVYATLALFCVSERVFSTANKVIDSDCSSLSP